MPKIQMTGEPRCERVAVFLTTKTKDDLTKIAAVHRTSMNMIINDAIEKYLPGHQNDIQRYNDFFGEE